MVASLPPSIPTPEPDLAAQATDVVVNLVDQVRSRTTRPALLVARGVVYGLLAGALAIVALVLVIAGLVRLVNVYLPGDVWAAHLLVGSILSLAGLFLWAKRKSPALETR